MYVERKSRYLVADKLNNKHSATFMTVSTVLFKQIEWRLIKTLTVDNGSEFAQFKTLEEATSSKISFAAPYSPWQRGLNENSNGLLRRYFQKAVISWHYSW